MSDSIHTARWINQIADLGWDIHLYPSIDYGITHKDLRNVTVYHSFYSWGLNSSNVKIKGNYVVFSRIANFLKRMHTKLSPDYSVRRLEKIVKKTKPDLIHSLETQNAGYLALQVKKKMGRLFPKWIHTNWGSDIYLFGRLRKHKKMIEELLSQCDYYSCECRRDVKLALKHGLKGQVLPVYPNTSGFDLIKLAKLKEKTGKTSARKVIMLKGYQGWAGRALVGIRALSRVKDLLSGYRIVIYSHSGSVDIQIAAELLGQDANVEVEIIPLNTPHEKIMSLHGEARISIGLSISDAISTSLLEAMVMGSFPIQSWTSCADEWVTDGKSGILVPPEDPEIIEKVIRKALTDDNLVDKAAKINWKVAEEKLDYRELKEKTVKVYKDIIKEGKRDVRKA